MRCKMTFIDDNLNTIIQGDCLEVMKQIPDKSIDLVLTDPPYLVNWQSNRRDVKHKLIENDNNDSWLDPVFNEISRIMKEDSLMVSFYGYPHADKFINSWRKHDLEIKSHIVWIKNNMGLGWFTRTQHETAYLLAKGKPSKPKKAYSDIYHATEKPVNLFSKLLKSFSEEGMTILDPFSGSGTTAIACHDLKRNFICIEKEPEYVAISQKRLKDVRMQLTLF